MVNIQGNLTSDSHELNDNPRVCPLRNQQGGAMVVLPLWVHNVTSRHHKVNILCEDSILWTEGFGDIQLELECTGIKKSLHMPKSKWFP